MVAARTVGAARSRSSLATPPSSPPLETGVVRAKTPNGEEVGAVHGAFGDNEVIILSDIADLAKDIDVSRCQRAKSGHGDHEDALEARKRADARLNAANRPS